MLRSHCLPQDKACYVYHLEDPVPCAMYTGHTDVIRAVSFLPTVNCYLTASWDKCVASCVLFST